MPDESGVAPECPLSQAAPKVTPKVARRAPGSDSEQDSGFSDCSSEHLGRCEGTDTEEPPGPGDKRGAHLGLTWLGHNLPGPQPPAASPHPLPLHPPPPKAAAVPRPEEPRQCHHPRGVPAELSPARLSPRLGGAVLAALALRTGALLRHNRRTQRDIAALRRHTRLLARATRDPRLWPRLCHLLRPLLAPAGPAGPSAGGREPPAFGEGAE